MRGPSVSPGYWNKPKETQAAYHDGWLRTGDMAKRDEAGFHILADRLKDMFISGGENVYPAEIEGVLAGHPAVAEVAVIGVPDPRWGEVGVAYVVLRPGERVGEDVLKDLCAKTLAAYKRPAHVVYLDAIPRNAAGKPQKHVLRETWSKTPAVART